MHVYTGDDTTAAQFTTLPRILLHSTAGLLLTWMCSNQGLTVVSLMTQLAY